MWSRDIRISLGGKKLEQYVSDSLVHNNKYDNSCNCIYKVFEHNHTDYIILYDKSESCMSRINLQNNETEKRKLVFIHINDYYLELLFHRNFPVSSNFLLNNLAFVKELYVSFSTIYVFFEKDVDVLNQKYRKKVISVLKKRLSKYEYYDKIVGIENHFVFDSIENLNNNYEGSGFYYFR